LAPALRARDRTVVVLGGRGIGNVGGLDVAETCEKPSCGCGTPPGGIT